jgi:hypothetical protein
LVPDHSTHGRIRCSSITDPVSVVPQEAHDAIASAMTTSAPLRIECAARVQELMPFKMTPR